jgi:hypothetical protein
MILSLVIVITLLCAIIDAQYLNEGYRFESHTTRWGLRALILIVAARDWSGMFINPTDLFFYSSVFYLIFDYSLNYFRCLPILYVGETSIIDRFWKPMPILQLIFKITLVITSISVDIYFR